MLTATDLRFRYDRRGPWVVDGLSLTLERGEIVGLRGPSGQGKTTFARLLAGYLTPASGRILLDGVPLPPSGVAPVQLVLQHPELAVDPRWRLHEILAETAATTADRAVIMDALSIHPAWLRRFPHELSGGELQRVAVARALLTDAPFVIADEVSAMLDPITQAQIWHVLAQRVRSGALGVLAISHDDALLDVVADRVLDLAALRGPAPSTTPRTRNAAGPLAPVGGSSV